MTLRRDTPPSIMEENNNREQSFKGDEQRVQEIQEDLPKGYVPTWRNEETLPGWLKYKFAIKEKIGFQHWRPKKRLSREVMDKIRFMNQQVNMTMRCVIDLLINKQ